MYLAINTASLASNTPRALAQAAALGFSHVEINLQASEFGYDYRRKADIQFYSRLREQVEDLGLSVCSVSPPRLNQEQMFSARARKEILLAAAAVAAKMDSRVYVVQPADIFENELSIQKYIQDSGAPPVVDGYDQTWAQIVNRRMTMALANREHWFGEILTNQAERLKKITADLAIDCALDVPNALRRNSLESWLNSVGDRLVLAYLYDIEEANRTVAPIDPEWREWLAALAKTRLNCLVLRAGAGQTNEEIIRSRSMIQETLTLSR